LKFFLFVFFRWKVSHKRPFMARIHYSLICKTKPSTTVLLPVGQV
jgi:hypothetical protein